MTIQPVPGPQPQLLVSIGNIHVSQQHVMTPGGTWPIADINVTTTDQTSTTTHTPAWAIVLVVLFIWFFLLSLLFLLVRERRVAGFVGVTVMAPDGRSYVENVPVRSDVERTDIFNRVTYLQSLVGQARWQQGR